MKIIKKLLALLSRHERRRAIVLMGLVLIMAFLDALGVASILPFIAVLANPETVQTNAVLATAFSAGRHIGILTIEQFFFAAGVLVFLLLITSLAFKAITTYMLYRFALMREYSIGKRLVEAYLNQPYIWFLNRHSAELGKTILSEVNTVIGGVLIPLLILFSQGTVALAIFILLIITDPVLAISVSALLLLFYVIIFFAVSGWVKRLGQARVEANQGRFMALSEAFGAIKELKFGGLEKPYAQRFSTPAKIYAKGQATANAIAQTPRFVLEAAAFGGMLLLILYLMADSGSFSAALPIIALYAFSGYRLMPALQQIYKALTQLRFAGPALDALYQDIRILQVDQSNLQVDKAKLAEVLPMKLKQMITLDQVTYTYPEAPDCALRGLNLSISARTKVGFVGSTGSGKTTTIDVILGLLEPQEGRLLIDGKPISSFNRRQWQSSIGYVPQNIYLVDDTVAANIAFGVDPELIDLQAVERAAKIANLHTFVCNELPQGYSTAVGERGIRLSGGQRQRIGIARALYHSPQVLILDEATSALDNLTEKAVMEAVQNLGRDITIILVAHRLSTVRQCDKIYLLDGGKVKASGTYDQLVADSPQFKAMADEVR